MFVTADSPSAAGRRHRVQIVTFLTEVCISWIKLTLCCCPKSYSCLRWWWRGAETNLATNIFTAEGLSSFLNVKKLKSKNRVILRLSVCSACICRLGAAELYYCPATNINIEERALLLHDGMHFFPAMNPTGSETSSPECLQRRVLQPNTP